ncbi:phytoene/squalene synthase family protein [Sphingomonas vulcanisoli]|uniref:phytoene/squalene synthase family protein n=1 Tax=Sphingomonas vulcanisoli TaxID=1658060 RepID=UPI003132E916
MDKGSKSFALASKLFAPDLRERAWLLYAWCRACDDIADGQEMGHGMTAVSDAPARIEAMRALTARALAGERTGEQAFDALGIVAAECVIPASLPFDVIEGFALDSVGWQPQTESDLYRYCYHVAGAVGVMMALVMGVRPDETDTLDRACDLGIAFQLGNIARDIGEDASVGRCYLPRDWLAEIGIAPDAVMADRAKLAVLGERLADRAALYEASARAGAARLSYRSAWAVLAAAGIYGGIAREVARRGARAWDARVSTSRAQKLRWAAIAAVDAWRAEPAFDRTALWTRPRTSNIS